jgi:cytochrome c peroxidase
LHEVLRIPVEREPVAAALTPDGRRLLVANHLPAGRADADFVAGSVSVIDTATRRVTRTIRLPNGATLLRGICVSPDGRWAAVTHTLARFQLPTTQIERGWINNNAVTLIDIDRLQLRNTVLLDNLDRGAADPWGIAWSADGKWLCVTHAGTRELSVIDAPALLARLARMPAEIHPGAPPDPPVTARSAAEVPDDMAFLVGLRARVKLAGEGPRAVALAAGRALVACYFSDSVAAVDLANPGNEPEAYPLGSSGEPSLARQGEMYFNDGTLSFQGWQSCAGCHSSDARVDGLNWDLLNDGIGNPKNARSLLLSFQTPPSMSLGVRANAGAAVRAGFRSTMFASVPEETAAAVDDYLKSLAPLPSPHLVDAKLSPAAQRGEKLFFDRAVGCAECHPPPLFTNLKPHEVGTTGKYDQPTDHFYTPTLIEIWRTAPYLHDGSAATLREVLTSRNRGDLHGKTSRLQPDEIECLVAYLLSL